MIKINYQIDRDEGDERVIYRPELLPTEFANVVYIKGPNSSGKSTLLNLIATGFFGQKLSEDELDEILRKKITSLLDIEHQRITFEINIDNPIIRCVLSSRKLNPETTDISVEIMKDGKVRTLSSENFYREFRIIYDIPHNPLDRLPQILQDIKNAQVEIRDKIFSFKNKLNGLIIDIQNSKDLDKIEELQNEINQYLNQQQEIEYSLKVLEKYQRKVLEYYLTRFYIEYDRKVREYFTKIRELENELNNAEKEGRKSARDQLKIEKQLQNETLIVTELFHDCEILLTRMIKNEEKEHLNLWKGANIDKEITQSEVYSTLREESKYFIGKFLNGYEYEKQAHSKELDTIEVYRLLLSTIANIKYNDVTLPGSNQTIEVFRQRIIEELGKYDSVVNKLKMYDEIIINLKEFEKALNRVISTFKKYNKLPKVGEILNGFDAPYLRNKLNETKKIKEKFYNFANKFRTELINNQFDPTKAPERYYTLSFEADLKHYEQMNEQSLSDFLSENRKKINEKKEQLSRYKEVIKKKKEELILLNEREPHHYRAYLQKLEVFLKSVQLLERKFAQQFTKYINDVIEKKEIVDEQGKIYAHLLGNLLASKIGTLKHVDRVYQVENVNIKAGIITTYDRKIIKFEDLGTGQGQAAFLLAKLAINDNRKIIALLDEVAMMDEKTLKPVKEKLVELYKEGKLLMAVIVQKSSDVEVENLV